MNQSSNIVKNPGLRPMCHFNQLRQEEDMDLEQDTFWRNHLTPDQYRVTRQGYTERAFSGKYWNHHADGTYACACCGEPLFDSRQKYDSGSGWPSFWAPIENNRLLEKEDASLGLTRTEILCAHCQAHLGHVFTDGPSPTGLRFCINSTSLQFKSRTGD